MRFLDHILPTSLPSPITLPRDLSYLHIPTFPRPTLDSLLESLWSLLASSTSPFLLPQLAHASVLDFTIPSPHAISIRVLWPRAPHPDGWRFDIAPLGDARVEVGVFGRGVGGDKDEIAVEGFRAVLGVHDEFEPVVFSFPHRDHVLRGERGVTVLEPRVGSHPVLRTKLTGVNVPNNTLDGETCELFGLYTLPKEVFVDKYQLEQLAQFKSGGILRVAGLWGETDLEDPAYMTPGWGSVLLIEVPRDAHTVEVPLHFRYLEPVPGGGYTPVDFVSPEIFWACENTVEGTPITTHLIRLHCVSVYVVTTISLGCHLPTRNSLLPRQTLARPPHNARPCR
jgi:PIG-X / PBN1